MTPPRQRSKAKCENCEDFISEYFYKCTKEILLSLGQMYAGGGEMTQNIDKMGGKGTAVFVAKAIQTYCKTDKRV